MGDLVPFLIGLVTNENIAPAPTSLDTMHHDHVQFEKSNPCLISHKRGLRWYLNILNYNLENVSEFLAYLLHSIMQ